MIRVSGQIFQRLDILRADARSPDIDLVLRKRQIGDEDGGAITARLVLIAIPSPFVSVVQSFVWTSTGEWMVPQRVAFVVDVGRATLELLDDLLGEVADGLDVPGERPPSQEKECMTVAALNLLNLQVGRRGWAIFHAQYFRACCQSQNVTPACG